MLQLQKDGLGNSEEAREVNKHWEYLQKYYTYLKYPKLRKEKKDNINRCMYELIKLENPSYIIDEYLDFFYFMILMQKELIEKETMVEMDDCYNSFKSVLREKMLNCVAKYGIYTVLSEVNSLSQLKDYIKKNYVRRLNDLYNEYVNKLDNNSLIAIILAFKVKSENEYRNLDEIRFELDELVTLYENLEKRLKSVLSMINTLQGKYREQYDVLVQKLVAAKDITDLIEIDKLINNLFVFLTDCIEEEYQENV